MFVYLELCSLYVFIYLIPATFFYSTSMVQVEHITVPQINKVF